MDFKKILPLFVLLLLFAFAITGCAPATGGGTPEAAAPGTPAVAATPVTPAQGDTAAEPLTLVVAQTSDATTLDPQKQGRMPDMNVLINIFDTLVARDQEGNMAPGLAIDWYPVDDVTWRLHLRQGVYFHNGEYFNAEAVKFSMDRLIDPETASPIAELRHLVATHIIDEYTVDMVTNEPDPILPNRLVLFGGVILPPDYVSNTDPEIVARYPVGTGPFQFVSWRRDSEIVLEAFDGHWRGRPSFDTLVFRVIPSWADMSASLRVGDVDVAIGLPADLVPEIEASPDVNLVSADWIRTFYVHIDTTVAPMDIREVRQAMNYAVDVQTIIDAVIGGHARQVSTILPHQNFGYDPNIQAFPYDPDRARQLLAEAGVPDGFTVAFDAINTDITVIMAIIGYLEAVGINVEVNTIDAASLTANMTARTAAPLYYIGNTGWTMDALSNFQSFIRSDRRFTRGNTPELDRLSDIQEQTIDPQIRQEAITAIQEILIEEAFFIYLWQLNNLAAVSTRVNYTPNVIGYLWMFDAQPAN